MCVCTYMYILKNIFKKLICSQFLQQYLHYKSTLEVFRLEPTQFNKSLDELVIFLAQVSTYN